jgi:hypothetical protein
MDAARKAKLGHKWLCFSCGIRFYDMNRADPICPRCETDQRTAPPPEKNPPKKTAGKKTTAKKTTAKKTTAKKTTAKKTTAKKAKKAGKPPSLGDAESEDDVDLDLDEPVDDIVLDDVDLPAADDDADEDLKKT